MNPGDLVFWTYEHYNELVLILEECSEDTLIVLMLSNMKKAAALYEELVIK